MGDADGGARLHIIVTDSRGTLLQDQINKVDSPYKSFIRVVPKSGATLEDIAQIAIGQAKAHLDSIVYLLGGTNNIMGKFCWLNSKYVPIEHQPGLFYHM